MNPETGDRIRKIKLKANLSSSFFSKPSKILLGKVSLSIPI
jgi:hypothetical protein